MAEKWQYLDLPQDLSGKTFLDIGCWEGEACAEAVRRNARDVVGVDISTSDRLRANVDEHGFNFMQLDVFSEKFLELPTFDIVLCAGVLYHVENVMSLIFRLRKTVSELLILESFVNDEMPDKPIMMFYPTDELGGNPSNWWSPNERCLIDMLQVAGFRDVRQVYEAPDQGTGRRLGLHATPSAWADPEKVMPRLKGKMGLYGGHRPGIK